MTKINSLRGMPDLYSDDLISWTSVENNLENIFKEPDTTSIRIEKYANHAPFYFLLHPSLLH